jgi:hypothetical protein
MLRWEGSDREAEQDPTGYNVRALQNHAPSFHGLPRVAADLLLDEGWYERQVIVTSEGERDPTVNRAQQARRATAADIAATGQACYGPASRDHRQRIDRHADTHSG